MEKKERIIGYTETLMKMRDNAPVGAIVVDSMDRTDVIDILKENGTIITYSKSHPDVILSEIAKNLEKQHSLVVLNVLSTLDKKIVEQLNNINHGSFQALLAG
ncbi:MAG: hypothetical protein HQK84_11420, partial [Nitrospinae bacterium]|nr:hypothetical protein [Nitrospinota bacterium]